ncbi:hypothetical protein ACFSTE_03980 [Aquimarina hainanensis]|uniref:Uncharacterized protein n=2 Tax=Aquimarina hainanensis TaxID=1578017 RepID=A0ABW5N396_9FLAO
MKEHFSLDSKFRKEQAINYIVETFQRNKILDFVFENFGCLKQHIYINTFNKDFTSFNPSPANQHSNYQKGTETIYNLLFEMNVQAFNKTQKSLEELEYLIPVQIRKSKLHLIVSFNTFERRVINSSGDNFVILDRKNSENSYIEIIKDSLPTGITFVPTDLNKGIKELWKEDKIKAKFLKHLRSSSVSTEVMMEDDNLKDKLPDLYNEALTNPLEKNVFVLVEEKTDIGRFTTEPMKGKISISRYAKNLDSVNDLVISVLDKN